MSTPSDKNFNEGDDRGDKKIQAEITSDSDDDEYEDPEEKIKEDNAEKADNKARFDRVAKRTDLNPPTQAERFCAVEMIKQSTYGSDLIEKELINKIQKRIARRTHFKGFLSSQLIKRISRGPLKPEMAISADPIDNSNPNVHYLVYVVDPNPKVRSNRVKPERVIIDITREEIQQLAKIYSTLSPAIYARFLAQFNDAKNNVNALKEETDILKKVGLGIDFDIPVAPPAPSPLKGATSTSSTSSPTTTTSNAPISSTSESSTHNYSMLSTTTSSKPETVTTPGLEQYKDKGPKLSNPVPDSTRPQKDENGGQHLKDEKLSKDENPSKPRR